MTKVTVSTNEETKITYPAYWQRKNKPETIRLQTDENADLLLISSARINYEKSVIPLENWLSHHYRLIKEIEFKLTF